MNTLRKSACLVATATLSAAILTFGLAVPADAATGKRTPSPSTSPAVMTVSAPLQIDCSTVTAAGRKYAVEHNVNICGILGSGTASSGMKPDGIATPDTTGSATSTCGTATITMYSLGAGRAYISWKLHSTSGLIIYYSVGTPYHGTAASGTISYSGAFPGNDAWGGNPAYTGRGYADTYLGGSVSTVLYDCTVLNPSAWTYV